MRKCVRSDINNGRAVCTRKVGTTCGECMDWRRKKQLQLIRILKKVLFK